jgi:hypothetical protein
MAGFADNAASDHAAALLRLSDLGRPDAMQALPFPIGDGDGPDGPSDGPSDTVSTLKQLSLLGCQSIVAIAEASSGQGYSQCGRNRGHAKFEAPRPRFRCGSKMKVYVPVGLGDTPKCVLARMHA